MYGFANFIRAETGGGGDRAKAKEQNQCFLICQVIRSDVIEESAWCNWGESI